MKRIILITSVLLIISFAPCSATIIYIPLDYPTIQYGINASSNGDTVLVQPGTYVENINFNGHNIVLSSLFLTTGDTSYISQTIIDGDSAGSVVTFESGEDSTAVISGFTIQNGYSSFGGGVTCLNNSNPNINNNLITQNYTEYYGGGILCDNNSNPAIINNKIAQNEADSRGGGIACTDSSNASIIDNIICNNSGENSFGIYCYNGSSPIISDNLICQNEGGINCWTYSNPTISNNIINANSGAGIGCSDNTNPVISNNIISDNFGYHGGGISGCGASPQISNNLIIGNSASQRGGGIYFCEGGDPSITGNIISGNTADDGGGIGVYYVPQIKIINNIVSGNNALHSGGGMYSASEQTITNTVFWANNASSGNQIYVDNIYGVPTINYCNIQDTLWPGEGNITIEPSFRDSANGDFHLMSIACGDTIDSPCIDSGSPHYSDSLLDCSWGLGSVESDMGAYGGGDSIIVGTNVINVPIDYPTIQMAIDSSNTGDTVLVQPDTYYENINFNGRNIVVGSMFMMTGDFSYVSSTIIDGSDTGSVVTFDSGEDSTARLIGFTIQNGRANHGGGVYCYGSDPTISNNIITDNFVYSFGGGVLFLESASIFNNNLVIMNSANQGGGICCMGSNPTIINNVLTGNSGNLSGAGIYCTLVSHPAIINTILWADIAPAGAEIDLDDSSTPSVSYCDIQGGWVGNGNISTDPLFRDTANSDFHLMSVACGDSADSPCIDAGRPNIPDRLLDCSWGLGSTRSDMGAYGGGDFPITAVIDEYLPAPRKLMLNQNYPNPFNAQTTISFILPEARNVQLTIYDLLGRQVRILLDEYIQAGVHSVTFDASDLSSGVYFYRLQAGERVDTKRMVLLK